jgi:hypothetical protein
MMRRTLGIVAAVVGLLAIGLAQPPGATALPPVPPPYPVAFQCSASGPVGFRGGGYNYPGGEPAYWVWSINLTGTCKDEKGHVHDLRVQMGTPYSIYTGYSDPEPTNGLCGEADVLPAAGTSGNLRGYFTTTDRTNGIVRRFDPAGISLTTTATDLSQTIPRVPAIPSSAGTFAIDGSITTSWIYTPFGQFPEHWVQYKGVGGQFNHILLQCSPASSKGTFKFGLVRTGAH